MVFASSSIKVATEGTSSRGQAMSSAVLQAEEVQSNLEREFPSFVKSLVRSHVASCFWMVSISMDCDKNTFIIETKFQYVLEPCLLTSFCRGCLCHSVKDTYRIRIQHSFWKMNLVKNT